MIAYVWHTQTWTNQLCVERFTADILLASGWLWDLYSLSKLISRNNGLIEYLLPFPFITVINKPCSETRAATATLLLSLLGLLNTACIVYAKVYVNMFTYYFLPPECLMSAASDQRGRSGSIALRVWRPSSSAWPSATTTWCWPRTRRWWVPSARRIAAAHISRRSVLMRSRNPRLCLLESWWDTEVEIKGERVSL